MQDLNSKANYEAYLKYTGEDSLGDTMNYSDTFESISGLTKSYGSEPERAINSAGYYDLSTINEESSQLSDYSEKQELTQVVDLYKCQIEKTLRQESETVSSPLEVADRVVGGDKKSALRKKCVDVMGQSNFEQVYKFLKQARESDVNDEVIREQALKRWGKAANNYCLLVDQLLFLEWY